MQYGSIGWGTGAMLGYALGARAQGKRAILFIGDGCFQISAQVPHAVGLASPRLPAAGFRLSGASFAVLVLHGQ